MTELRRFLDTRRSSRRPPEETEVMLAPLPGRSGKLGRHEVRDPALRCDSCEKDLPSIGDSEVLRLNEEEREFVGSGDGAVVTVVVSEIESETESESPPRLAMSSSSSS